VHRFLRNPAAWSRREGLPGLLLLGLLVLGREWTAALRQGQPQTSEQVAPPHVRYHFTAEATYQEIEVAGTKLSFTYFEDIQHRCEHWLEQRPCWTPADLTTKEATLYEDEVRDLRNLIEKSKFMDLDEVYGGAPRHQRYYAYRLSVELGGITKEVTYQSFPEAPAPPEAFEAVRKRLFEIVAARFGRQESADREELVELKTLASPNGQVTAHWSGQKPEPGAPVEFGVKKLWFTFAGDEAVYEFRPPGELFFSDWNFEIFSPDGAYVVLLQDRFGPFHVLRTNRLKRYLQGITAPDRTVRASDYLPHASDPAKVHHFARWTSGRSFEFTASCCGTEMHYGYDIRAKKLRLLAEKPAP